MKLFVAGACMVNVARHFKVDRFVQMTMYVSTLLCKYDVTNECKHTEAITSLQVIGQHWEWSVNVLMEKRCIWCPRTLTARHLSRLLYYTMLTCKTTPWSTGAVSVLVSTRTEICNCAVYIIWPYIILKTRQTSQTTRLFTEFQVVIRSCGILRMCMGKTINQITTFIVMLCIVCKYAHTT